MGVKRYKGWQYGALLVALVPRLLARGEDRGRAPEEAHARLHVANVFGGDLAPGTGGP